MTGFTGKRYFYWLGQQHAKAGFAIMYARGRRMNWPMYARQAFIDGWFDYRAPKK